MKNNALKLDQIGPALRLLRESRGDLQNHVALSAGVTKALMSAWERGRQAPSLASLLKILNASGSDFRGLQAAIDALQALKTARQPPTAEEARSQRVRKAVEAILEVMDSAGETGAS